MSRGEYAHYIGQLTEPALSPEMKAKVQRSYERAKQAFEADLESAQLPLGNVLAPADDPWGRTAPLRPQRQPWTDEQKRDFQRTLGLSAIGSVAGAVLWKDHRIWGFILGGMAGGGLARVIFAPTSPENSPW